MSAEVQRPTSNDDREAWKVYWEAQGMPWRTEPEIDEERQRYLKERRAIRPVMSFESVVFPFQGETLIRADVEWLLATHSSGGVTGPVDWNDTQQRQRTGLDLRGADLRNSHLERLPLARMCGGLNFEEMLPTNPTAWADAAAVHLESAELNEAHLEGSILGGAHLEAAGLNSTNLTEAFLQEGHLENAILRNANLKRALLWSAFLEGSHMANALLQDSTLLEAHLQLADMESCHLERATLADAHLEAAILSGARLDGANLSRATLCGGEVSQEDAARINRSRGYLWPNVPSVLDGADLREVFIDAETNLKEAALGHKKFGSAALADVHWGDVNLSVVDWNQVASLGDDRMAALESNSKRGRQKPQRRNAPRSKKVTTASKLNTSRHQRYSIADKSRPIDRHLVDTYGATSRLGNFAVQRARLEFTALQGALRANLQLATALRSRGMHQDADRFAYRAQVLQRGVYRRQKRYAAAVGSWFLDLISGYGYNPMRSFITYLAVVGGFATAYYVISYALLTPIPGPVLSPLDAVVFSMTSFHGRGFVPNESMGLSNPLTVLAAIEAFFGLLIEIVFIATFTQRFFAR